MVGRRKDDDLTGQLVDYLVEGAEQTLKNHNLLFKLHLELGDFDQAAKMAVLIARQEQVRMGGISGDAFYGMEAVQRVVGMDAWEVNGCAVW